ncbi:WD repeat-containing protein [Dirofilaria immitis]
MKVIYLSLSYAKKQAESYYEKGENHKQLIRCYLMDDNYDKMQLLAKHLPDGDKLIATEIAIKDLLEEDSKISLADSILIDNAWRGAEAYHFYMLAHRQLYNALSSCTARQFAVCSRAFIKLESLDSFTADERETYKKLAIKIFSRYPPTDTRINKVECTECYAQIQDYCQVCPSCDIKFPTCVASGRPLLDQQFWLCSTCKHRAYKEEINLLKFCPLCHGKL